MLTVTLLKEATASLAFMAAAVSDFQPTVTNCVIILQHYWDYICLKLHYAAAVCLARSVLTASVAGSVRAKGGAGVRAAHLPSGHLGTTCQTLLLSPLVSFVNPVSLP